jgi:transcriptional regulator with XRE-family HTH domain
MTLSLNEFPAGPCITQADLANYLGVSRALVEQPESGQNEESAALAKKLKALSASIKRASKNPKASSISEFKAEQDESRGEMER